MKFLNLCKIIFIELIDRCKLEKTVKENRNKSVFELVCVIDMVFNLVFARIKWNNKARKKEQDKNDIMDSRLASSQISNYKDKNE